MLRDYGGIYLDIDTYVIRPFADKALMMHDVVMGMEAKHLNLIHGPMSDNEMEPQGLCNGVIIARKNAEFINRWLGSYDTFQERQWAVHSVVSTSKSYRPQQLTSQDMPWLLARLYPTLITVMSERAFFWPLWTADHIHGVYETTEYDFHASGQLAYHAWESKSKHFLHALNPTTIHHIDTSFTRMVKPFREHDEERRWKAHLKHDKAQGQGHLSWGGDATDNVEQREGDEVLEYKKRSWSSVGSALSHWGGADR